MGLAYRAPLSLGSALLNRLATPAAPGSVLSGGSNAGRYGIYLAAILVVLLNLLIAVMSSTYEELSEVSTLEWHYARTQIVLQYKDQKFWPAPLNVRAARDSNHEPLSRPSVPSPALHSRAFVQVWEVAIPV